MNDIIYDLILESLADYVESGDIDMDDALEISEAAYDELFIEEEEEDEETKKREKKQKIKDALSVTAYSALHGALGASTGYQLRGKKGAIVGGAIGAGIGAANALICMKLRAAFKKAHDAIHNAVDDYNKMKNHPKMQKLHAREEAYYNKISAMNEELADLNKKMKEASTEAEKEKYKKLIDKKSQILKVYTKKEGLKLITDIRDSLPKIAEECGVKYDENAKKAVDKAYEMYKAQLEKND